MTRLRVTAEQLQTYAATNDRFTSARKPVRMDLLDLASLLEEVIDKVLECTKPAGSDRFRNATKPSIGKPRLEVHVEQP